MYRETSLIWTRLIRKSHLLDDHCWKCPQSRVEKDNHVSIFLYPDVFTSHPNKRGCNVLGLCVTRSLSLIYAYIRQKWFTVLILLLNTIYICY